jgi:hypothetical protein
VKNTRKTWFSGVWGKSEDIILCFISPRTRLLTAKNFARNLRGWRRHPLFRHCFCLICLPEIIGASNLSQLPKNSSLQVILYGKG